MKNITQSWKKGQEAEKDGVTLENMENVLLAFLIGKKQRNRRKVEA